MIAAKDGQIENVYVANWKKTGIDGEAGVEGVNGVVGAAVNAANEMPPMWEPKFALSISFDLGKLGKP